MNVKVVDILSKYPSRVWIGIESQPNLCIVFTSNQGTIQNILKSLIESFDSGQCVIMCSFEKKK